MSMLNVTPTTSDAVDAVAHKTADLTHEVVERARQTSLSMRNQAHRVGERTAAYVQDEPMKAVLIAAASGALIAAAAGWLLRSRS